MAKMGTPMSLTVPFYFAFREICPHCMADQHAGAANGREPSLHAVYMALQCVWWSFRRYVVNTRSVFLSN